MSSCRGCGGYEKIGCPKCNGSGRNSPIESSITECLSCTNCHGQGETICPHCDVSASLQTDSPEDAGE